MKIEIDTETLHLEDPSILAAIYEASVLARQAQDAVNHAKASINRSVYAEERLKRLAETRWDSEGVY